MGKRDAGRTGDADVANNAGCMNDLVVLNASDIPQNVRSSPYTYIHTLQYTHDRSICAIGSFSNEPWPTDGF